MDARITAVHVNQPANIAVTLNTPFVLEVTTADRIEWYTDQDFVRQFCDWRDMLGIFAMYGFATHRHLYARCVRFARNNRMGVLPDLLQ